MRPRIQALADVEKLGIMMIEVTGDLEEEGVGAFSDAFTVLLKAVDECRQAAAGRCRDAPTGAS